jgi:hypothetical protein
MSYPTPEPVVSGRAYPVREAGGRAPESLDDFVRSGEFVIEQNGAPYSVQGQGAVHDDVVRFHEKVAGGGGKDLRVWHVRRTEGDGFVAETV